MGATQDLGRRVDHLRVVTSRGYEVTKRRDGNIVLTFALS